MIKGGWDTTKAMGLQTYAFYFQKQDCKPSKKGEPSTSVFLPLRGAEKHVPWAETTDYNAKHSRLAVPGIWSYLEPHKLLLYRKEKTENNKSSLLS